jgi:hypothetical protein
MVSAKTRVQINIDEIDEEVLAEAGLKTGQEAIAEVTDAGILLRSIRPEERASSAAETDAQQMFDELGLTPLSVEEAQREFADLPSDEEG